MSKNPWDFKRTHAKTLRLVAEILTLRDSTENQSWNRQQSKQTHYRTYTLCMYGKTKICNYHHRQRITTYREQRNLSSFTPRVLVYVIP